MTSSGSASPNFANLAKHLLKGGIAPRHVRRTVEELRDHYSDLREEFLKNGLSQSHAEKEAVSRLGKEDDLVAEVLSKEKLRSWTSRWPWALYGITPIIATLSMMMMVMTTAVDLTVGRSMLAGSEASEVAIAMANSAILFSVYASPILVSIFVFYQAISRRDSLIWPSVSLALLWLFTITTHCTLAFPTPELQGFVSVSNGYPDLGLQTLIRALASPVLIVLFMIWFKANARAEQKLGVHYEA